MKVTSRRTKSNCLWTWKPTRKSAVRHASDIRTSTNWKPRLAVTKSMITKGVNTGKLKVLKDFMRQRKMIELQQAADDSKKETPRFAAKRGRSDDDSQLRAELEAAKLTYSVEMDKWDLFRRQIAACRPVAPQAGEVVYAAQNNSRGSEPVVIEEALPCESVRRLSICRMSRT